MRLPLATIGLAAFVFSGCAFFTNEGYRTTRAYDAAVRGREQYDAEKSLKYAEELNTHLTGVFQARTQTVVSALAGTGPSTLSSPGGGTSSGGKPGAYYYNLDKFWPTEVATAAVGKTDAQNVTPFVREMNNIFSMQYLRDLVTEPSIHAMVPMYREVTLKCTPPPEQSVIQTAAAVAASVKAKGAEGAIDARLAESVVKLFEQTERTIFLQYALFRLCEMSINSAGEFRNVFPVMIHELVRQSAALTLEASVEAERTKRAAADAEAARAQTSTTIAQIELKRLECVKAQQALNKSATADAITAFCGPAPKAALGWAPVEDERPPAAPDRPTSLK